MYPTKKVNLKLKHRCNMCCDGENSILRTLLGVPGIAR